MLDKNNVYEIILNNGIHYKNARIDNEAEQISGLIPICDYDEHTDSEGNSLKIKVTAYIRASDISVIKFRHLKAETPDFDEHKLQY